MKTDAKKMLAQMLARNDCIRHLEIVLVRLDTCALDPIYGNVAMLPREEVAKMHESLEAVKDFLEKRKC